MTRNPGVSWDDVAELGDAKRLLKEAVVLPMLMPEVFTGIREPWKGVLLYGPPGTGKTLLAKAVASECQMTFFTVSAATLVSRYHGDSEKMVKTLFEMARYYAPSVLFFDEIDALMMTRGGSNESEATRRLKVEMLQQIDGIGSASEGGMVMILATTNKPWDLDDALRRRLEKRIHIPIPDAAARTQAFKIHLESVQLEGDSTSQGRNRDTKLQELAAMTEGYSGADIRLVSREAAMMPMRRLTEKFSAAQISELKCQGRLEEQLELRMDDFVESLKRTQSSVDSTVLAQYRKWEQEFGSS